MYSMYRKIIENAGIGIAQVSLDGKWLDVNTKVCDIVGYSKQELLQTTFQDITFADDLETDLHYVKQMLEGTIQNYSMDKRYIKKDGNLVWIKLTVALEYKTDGSPNFFISTIEDIDKFKNSQQRLIASEKRYENALKGSNDGLWDWNIKTSEVYFSPRSKEMLGFKESEISASLQEWEKRVHPDDLAEVKKSLQNHMKGMSEYYINEHRVLCKDGTYKWILDRGVVVEFREDGEPLRMTGTHTDITQQKYFEQEFISQQKYRRIFELSEDPMLVIYEEKFVMANKSALKTLGYSSDKLFYSIKPYEISPETQENGESSKELSEMIMTTTMEKGYHRFEWTYKKLSGELFLAEVTLTKIPYKDSYGIFCVWRDIGEQKAAIENLKKSKDEFRTMFEVSKDGLAILDKKGNFIRFNHAYQKMTKYSREELLTKSCIGMTIPSDMSRMVHAYKEIMEKGYIRNFEKSCYCKDGSVFTVNMTATLMPDKKHVFVSAKDVTETKKLRFELEQHLYYDELTKLPNKTYFEKIFYEYMKELKKTTEKAALILIDIDDLKDINDSFGHVVGDRVIKQFVQLLISCISGESLIARFSGDVFLVLIKNITDKQEELIFLNKFKSMADKAKITFKDHDLKISFSAGITMLPENGTNFSILTKKSGAALHAAKNDGKRIYQYYKDTHTENAIEKVIMNASLHHAYGKKEFVLFYQPQYKAKDDSIVGLEALIRWKHPSLGLIPPDMFMGQLEESNLMLDVGYWVLEQAFKQTVLWHSKGFNTGIVSVNISMAQLSDLNEFVSDIKNLLSKTSCKASWIGFEITESVMMKNAENVIYALEELSALGIQIIIDDFGTGYSSLSYLKRMPIDKLKIDKSFIDDLSNNSEDATLVKTIIDLAKNLDIKLIAEGVEKHEQKTYLLEHGCNEIQGFLYSKPLAVDQLTSLLES